MKRNIVATGMAAGVIIGGLGANVASGAPMDTTPAPTAVAGNPPAARVEPPSTGPSRGADPKGHPLGVGSPGTGSPARSSNLPTAGLGPHATGGTTLPMALLVLGLAGFALVAAGTTLSRKHDR